MTAAILAVRPAALPGIVPPKGATTSLVRLVCTRPSARRPAATHLPLAP